MSKSFIDVQTSTKKHWIFTGKNALQQAVFFDTYGRVATPDQLYGFRGNMKHAVSWSDCKSKNMVKGTEICGHGVHAKMYITEKNSVIMSSQNNGSSPLFEFAILYAGKGRKMNDLRSFVSNSIERAVAYSGWWRRNSKWQSK